jgi:hypothetical protein
MVSIQQYILIVAGRSILKHVVPLVKHRLHTCLEKGLIERAIQYFKDRTENFDDYYPCTKSRLCNLSHVYKWLCLFVFMHYAMIANIKFSILRYVIGR